MDYNKIYKQLISRAQQRVLEGYNENHHVVPKCIGGVDDKSNIASLTPEEHYLAHLLLVKMHPGNRKLMYAAWMMTVSNNRHERSSNKIYGWLRRKRSTMGVSAETKAKIREARAKQVITAEHRRKIAESNKGKKHSPGTKAKIGQANSAIINEKIANGTHEVWNHGVSMSSETKDKLSKSLKHTYDSGRELSPSCFKKGRTPWNKNKAQAIVKCPYCGKQGGISVMKRWHFDNCDDK